MLLAGFLATSYGATAGAQEVSRARVDSLAARLDAAEQRVRRLEAQLAADSQAAVRTRSRMSLEFRGRVVVNAFGNTRRVNSTGNPSFVRPDDPGDPHPRGIAMHTRQTMLGLTVKSRDVWGADFTGDFDVDFHGGQLPSSGGRFFPLPRIRTARAILAWKRVHALAGQDRPLVSGVNPLGLAAVGTPGFSAAGNLWMWRPQIRVGVETGDALRLGVEGAVLAPGAGAAAGTFEVPDFDVAERAVRPFLQGRVRAAWGRDKRAAEVGLAGHIGWFRTAIDTLARGAVVGLDAVVPLNDWLEVRGEAYDGRGARALGGGGVSQLFGIDAALVRSRGGWAQINVRPATTLVVGAGAGVDDPHDNDLPASARLKNAATAIHAEWRPAGPLVFGAEFRRTRTTYFPRAFTNDHLNLVFGFEF